jgi:phosphoribosylformylglycinamidine cyclo-ligase
MSRYKALGVDVKKEGIKAFEEIIGNLYPEAFCVVTPDPHDSRRGLVSHVDSAGSKPILSYLYWKETGDPLWFEGLSQDALAMNINDILCVGAEPISFVDYIAFNTLLIDRIQLLSSLSKGFAKCFNLLADQGMKVQFCGGETADLPDQMKTLDVCGAIFGRLELKKVVTGEKIVPGDLVIGLRSGGPIKHEKYLNSGIMCNGHTLARNSLMDHGYLDIYPELAHSREGRFTGRYRVDDYIDEIEATVGEALNSPTRIYAPIAAEILEELQQDIHGMVHNTGGGQTKCLRLGRGIRYVKDSNPEPDPIFLLIQREAKVEWREMYEDFNMGVGFEIITNLENAEKVIGIAESYGIGAQLTGRCERSAGDNILKIKSPFGDFIYS